MLCLFHVVYLSSHSYIATCVQTVPLYSATDNDVAMHQLYSQSEKLVFCNSFSYLVNDVCVVLECLCVILRCIVSASVIDVIVLAEFKKVYWWVFEV